jgi:hypothetical protein
VKASHNVVDLLLDCITGFPRAKSHDLVVKIKSVIDVESDAKNSIDITVVRKATDKLGGF